MPTFSQLVSQMSQATGLSTGVINAQVMAESGYNPNAVSPAGAEGWLQFEPGTYNEYAAAAGVAPGTEFNPVAESKVYDVFMRALLKEFGGNVQKALAAYNAGPGNIAAGMGYANGILAQAGESTSHNAQAVAVSAPSTVIAPKVPRVSTPISTTRARPATPVTPSPLKPRPLPSPAVTASPLKPRPTPSTGPTAHQLHEQHLAYLAHLRATGQPLPKPPAPKPTVATTAQKGLRSGGTRAIK